MLTKGVLAAAATLALVACGSAAASHASSSGVLAARHSSSGGTWITLHRTKLGKVLATKSGKTLYAYKPDTKNHSHCNAGCSSIWPPLMANGKLHAGPGVKAGLLGTAMRSNGKRQVTYKGHPLYQYTGDSKAGQTSGQGYQGIWHVVNASGAPVTHSGGGGTTAPTYTYPGGY